MLLLYIIRRKHWIKVKVIERTLYRDLLFKNGGKSERVEVIKEFSRVEERRHAVAVV